MVNIGLLGSIKLVNGNCEGNIGCGQMILVINNYGVGFNDIGGGIYVLEWIDDYIVVWFFLRNFNICKFLVVVFFLLVLNISNFGMFFVKFVGNGLGNCFIFNYFKDYNIVFDMMFCGDWVGQVWGQDDICKSLVDMCEDWVGQNLEGFQEVYWLVNDIKVYQQVDQGLVVGQMDGGFGVQRKLDEERRRVRSFEV